MNPAIAARIASDLEAEIRGRIVAERLYRKFQKRMDWSNRIILRAQLRSYNRSKRLALTELDRDMAALAAGDVFAGMPEYHRPRVVA